MKKISTMVLVALLLTACGETEINKATSEVKEVEEPTEVATETEVEPVEEAAQVSEYPFPANTQPIGDATIVISTPGGTSADGNVPVLFVQEGDSAIQIGINYDYFDGSVETYVYINEMFSTKEQVGERSQGSLTLSEDNLLPGDYTVTAVQYTDNDPAKEPTTFTQASFKIE